MTNKALSIFNQLRPVTVGFDNVFDHFERMFENDIYRMPSATNFPPYNIVKTGEYTYDVELALAGFSKNDIDVEYKDNMLTVKSKEKDKSEAKDTDGVLHRGISKRWFSKSFQIFFDFPGLLHCFPQIATLSRSNSGKKPILVKIPFKFIKCC